MGTSDKVLKGKIEKVIVKLEEPSEGQCKAHGSLAEGVKVLLEIQAAYLDGKVHETPTSIKFGNWTVTGGAGVFVICCFYAILKFHGVI